MIRTIAFACTLLATAAAWAQTTYNPKIAYTQVASGKSLHLYLANSDGTHAVRVTTSVNINSVDFAPGGGRIAFSDNHGIKVMNYTASNAGIAASVPQLLVAGTYLSSPDFSPDGSRIMYHDPFGGGVKAISLAPASTPVALYSGCGWSRWLRTVDMGNAFACYKSITGPNVPGVYEIWVVLLDADFNLTSAGRVLSTETQAFKGISEFDVARTRNALLMVVSYPTTTQIVEFDIVTGLVTDKDAGTRVHYSADDSRIIFISPHLASGDYVSSLDSAGLVTRLTKKGSYGTTDAQP